MWAIIAAWAIPLSVTQALGDRVEITPRRQAAPTVCSFSNRPMRYCGRWGRPSFRGPHYAAALGAVQAETLVPATGTHLATSYGWTDPNVLMPIHVSLTGRSDQKTGWNVTARQPLPSFGGMHMEMTVDLRNYLLAQGLRGHPVDRRPRPTDQRSTRGAGRPQLHFLNRLLLRHAVQRSQTQNQIAAGDANYSAIGEQNLECAQRSRVVLVAESRHQHQLASDIEVRVTRWESLTREVHGLRHLQSRDVKILADPQTFQILLEQLMIHVGLIGLDHRDHRFGGGRKRARSSMWPCVSSPPMPRFSQMTSWTPR